MLQDLVTFIFIIIRFFPKSIMNEERDKDRLEKFGKHLKKTRQNLGLTQDVVVSKCDLTKGNLSMIENGKKDFLFSTFLEIRRGFNIDGKELLDFDKEEEPGKENPTNEENKNSATGKADETP